MEGAATAVSQSRPRPARRSPGPPANVTCSPDRASDLTPLPVPVTVTALAGALLADRTEAASLASCGTAPRVVDAGSRPASVLSSLLASVAPLLARASAALRRRRLRLFACVSADPAVPAIAAPAPLVVSQSADPVSSVAPTNFSL